MDGVDKRAKYYSKKLEGDHKSLNLLAISLKTTGARHSFQSATRSTPGFFRPTRLNQHLFCTVNIHSQSSSSFYTNNLKQHRYSFRIIQARVTETTHGS